MFLISGAVLIAIVAWFVFRSGSKGTSNHEGEKTNTTKKEPAKTGTSDESVIDPEKSPFWKLKRSILAKVRSVPKPEIEKKERKVKSTGNEGEKKKETKTLPVPEPVSLEAEAIIPIEPAMVASVDLSPNENSGSGEMEMAEYGEFQEDAGELLLSMEQDTEEASEPEESPIIPVEVVQEKSRSGSDIFSMFTDDVGEESEVSLFAAKLDPIDIYSLLEEVENIRKCIRR